MATVPTMDEGSAVERPLPTTPQALPSPGAFGGQVGQAVEGVGEEVSRIAQDEMQKAAGDRALQAETAYQELVSKKVYDVNEGFASLTGEKALAASAGVKQSISQDRERIAASLGSRGAARLFMNNSQRILRFAQDHVDQYAGQQRRVMQAQSYTRSVVSSAQFATTLATTKTGYDPEAGQALLEDAQKKAYERAAQLGLSEEDAHDFAAKSLSVPVDALVGTLVHTGNPAGKAMLESDWAKYISPGKVAGLQNAVYGKAVDNTANEIVAAAPRVDFSRSGIPDPDGPIDEGAVYRMAENAPEELRPSLYPALTKLLDKAKNDHERAVKARVSQIYADGTDRDPTSPDYGKFVGIDRVKSADQIAWMIRSGSPALDKLNEVERRKNTTGAVQDNKDSLVLLRSNLVKKLETDPEALKKMTPVDLLAETMRNEYPGFDSNGLRQAQEILNGLQKHPRIMMLEGIPKHVDDILQAPDMFPGAGDADLRRQYRDELISELSEAMRFPEFKVDDVSISQFIHRAMEKKVTAEHWYGNSTKRLVEIREEMRKAQGGGRLPIRVKMNRNTGEVRIFYQGEEEGANPTPPAVAPDTVIGTP